MTAVNRFNPVQEASIETASLRISSILDDGSAQWSEEMPALFVLPYFRPAELGSGGGTAPTVLEGTKTFGLPIGEVAVPALQEIRRSYVPPRHRQRFIVLQKWEGTVVSVDGDAFTAVMRDLADPSRPDEQMTLSLEEIAPSDRDLLEPGAILYWSLGYRETLSGSRERVALLRFRRLPVWTRGDLREVERKARRLGELFG
jgi:hypothetical protein